MNEYLLIGLKTLLFLTIILIIIRIMGKRELGQLNVFDIIISFMISEIFSNAIADPHGNILLALLPIFLIFSVQIFMSFIVLKSNKIRNVIESKPSLIIDNGIINYSEMKKQRYNISDLLQQVREEGIDDITKIAFAILESNGALSIIQKNTQDLQHPFPIISDGIIEEDLLNKLQIDKETLISKLNKLGYIDEKEIFMCFVNIDKELILFSKKENNIQ